MGVLAAGIYAVGMEIASFPGPLADIKTYVMALVAGAVFFGYALGAIFGYVVGRRLRLNLD